MGRTKLILEALRDREIQRDADFIELDSHLNTLHLRSWGKLHRANLNFKTKK